MQNTIKDNPFTPAMGNAQREYWITVKLWLCKGSVPIEDVDRGQPPFLSNEYPFTEMAPTGYFEDIKYSVAFEYDSWNSKKFRDPFSGHRQPSDLTRRIIEMDRLRIKPALTKQ